MRLAKTIYLLRTQKGMSQGDLAEALDVSRQSVSKWETGGATPDLDKLVKMSELFGVTLDELVMGEKGETETQPERQPEPQVVYMKREREDDPKRKTAAPVLFGFAVMVILICTILGGVLVGLLFSLPFWVCGVICMVCKKRCGLWCAWAVFFMVAVYFRMATGVTWGTFLGLRLYYKIYGLGAQFWVSLAMTAAVASLVVWTVLSFRKKTLEPSQKVIVKLIAFAVIFLICKAVPWAFSKLTEQYVANISSGQDLAAYSYTLSLISSISMWGSLWVTCTGLVDLLAIWRYRKNKRMEDEVNEPEDVH